MLVKLYVLQGDTDFNSKDVIPCTKTSALKVIIQNYSNIVYRFAAVTSDYNIVILDSNINLSFIIY